MQENQKSGGILRLRLLKSRMIGDHLRLDMLQKRPRQRRRNAVGFGLGLDPRQLGPFAFNALTCGVTWKRSASTASQAPSRASRRLRSAAS